MRQVVQMAVFFTLSDTSLLLQRGIIQSAGEEPETLSATISIPAQPIRLITISAIFSAQHRHCSILRPTQEPRVLIHCLAREYPCG